MSVDAIFMALADPTRRALFDTLRRAPTSVQELADRFPVSRGAVSQHLKVLLDARLADVETRGRQRIYRARPDAFGPLASYINEAAPPDDPVARELAKWRSQAPHIDPGALALLMYFAQIGQYVFKSNEEVAAQAGLSFGDVTLLGALRRLGPPYESTPTRLARSFWISVPGMTKRLARLETLGMLHRKDDPGDGRGVLLRLTAKGLNTLRDLVAHHQPPEYHALLELGADERRQLMALLARLLDLIDRAHHRRRPPYLIR
ncbi:MAG TPA: metalloregulator ArsR/SmtB family transcription factor [Solimonas sp.]|nr:metalloregulator ArsR/SmtB family transcription factor [Solimonas sp.]